MITRRNALQRLLAMGAGALTSHGALAQQERKDPAKLVLLGTKGGPNIRNAVQLPQSNALVIGARCYLIDAGYGASLRLAAAKIPLTSIQSIFITHHHSDHNLDVGPIVYNAWVDAIRRPIDVWGPAGTDALIRSSLDAYKFDIDTRMADEGRPDPRRLVVSHDYTSGLVMENEDVRVTALRNRHPPITESYALKFEISGGKTIVFSGDTTYFPPLAEFARHADYLVHEVMLLPAMEKVAQRAPNAKTLLKHLVASHTTTEDVGRIAAAAGVENLVLTHFVPGVDAGVPDEEWLRGVRAHYAGKVILGRDLLEVPL